MAHAVQIIHAAYSAVHPADRRVEPNCVRGTPTRVLRKLVASLLVVAGFLLNGWAAADVVMHDLVPLLEDHERLRDELLPVVQDCPQVAATIRTQDFTEDEFAAVCVAFKETADRFHATMRTDPGSPYLNANTHVQVLAFSNHEDKVRYYSEVYGYDNPGYGGQFLGGTILIDHHKSPFPEVGSKSNEDWVIWRHEFVHHLQFSFLPHAGPREGMAVYLQSEDGYMPPVLGDGSNLPRLVDAYRSVSDPHWRYSEGGLQNEYTLGYMVFAFLIEEHPQVMFTIFDMYADYYARVIPQRQMVEDVEETLRPLEDDFHRWLLEFVPIATQPIESITVFARSEKWIDGYYVRRITAAGVELGRFFGSTRDLTYSVSLSIPHETSVPRTQETYYSIVDIKSEILDFQLWNGTYTGTEIAWNVGVLFIRNTSVLGSFEVTVTATTPDGESAQQTFTINVVRDLQLREIAVRDPLSTDEGTLWWDLSAHFSGPDLQEVKFGAESSNPDVALATIGDGRLVVTAVAPGEAEITVRGNYLGRIREQTFTLAVTDDCPSWLCRSAFAGWRSTLLPQATETGATRTLPETQNR